MFEAIPALPRDWVEVNGQTVHLGTCCRCTIQRKAMDAHEKVLSMIRTVNELFDEVGMEIWECAEEELAEMAATGWVDRCCLDLAAPSSKRAVAWGLQ